MSSSVSLRFPLIKHAPITFSAELHHIIEDLVINLEDYSLEEIDSFIQKYPENPHLKLMRVMTKLGTVKDNDYLTDIEALYKENPSALCFKLELSFRKMQIEPTAAVAQECLLLLSSELAAVRGEQAYPTVLTQPEYHQLLLILAQIAVLTDNEILIKELFAISIGCTNEFGILLAYRLKGLDQGFVPPLDFEEFDTDLLMIFPFENILLEPHFELTYDILNKGFFCLDKKMEAKLLTLDKQKLEADLRWVLAQGTQQIVYSSDEVEYLIVVFHLATLTGIHHLSYELLGLFMQFTKYDQEKLFGDFSVELMLYSIFQLVKVDHKEILALLLNSKGKHVLKFCLIFALGQLYKEKQTDELLAGLNRVKEHVIKHDQDNIFWFALAVSDLKYFNEWTREQQKNGHMAAYHVTDLEDFFDENPYECDFIVLASCVECFEKIQSRLYKTFYYDYNNALLNIIKKDRELMDERLADIQDEEMFDDLNERVLKQSLTSSAPKIGRNDPCPCGSGNKYKKCCWAKLS